MPHTTDLSHPIVEAMLRFLDTSQREFYEERAGILQFDAHLSQPLAEAVALLEVVKRDGWPPRHTRKGSRLI